MNHSDKTHHNDNNDYDANRITVLDFPDCVRKRPGMYIGDTDDESGLHHMVYEVLDNAIDEALAGHCDHITLTMHTDGSVSVEDNGRGIPTGQHKTGVSAAELVMTKLHAGGKFNQDSYKVSGGLHGVGVSVVNALSDWLTLTIYRDGKEHIVQFKSGITTKPLTQIGTTTKQGTHVRFCPAREIFSVRDFRYTTVLRRARELAFLNPNLRIEIVDENTQRHEMLHYQGGLVEYARYISEGKKLLIEPITINDTHEDVTLEIAMAWSENFQETALYFTNMIPQKDGGTHTAGFRSALTRVVQNALAEKANKKFPIAGDDAREGLVLVLSVKVADPKFSSQTKDKLVSSNVRSVVDNIVTEKLTEWIDCNQDAFKPIANKILQAAKIRYECRAKKEIMRKNLFSSTSLPGVLADCSEKDPALSEIFIVEGESAGGSAKNARNRKIQAILPIRGKLMNVERVFDARVISSDAISSVLATMGCGWGNDCDADKARYHKIVLMTDADVDGNHIRTLILTLFYRYMRPLIERGYLYIAQPPLYGIKRGNKVKYAKDDKALNDFLITECLKHSTLCSNGRELESETLAQLIKHAQRNTHLSQFGHMGDALFLWKCCNQNLSDALRIQFPGSEWHTEHTPEQVCITERRNAWARSHRFAHAALTPETANANDMLYTTELQLQMRAQQHRIFGPRNLIDTVITQEQKNHTLQRYKGLGEMLAEQLWETTMNPDDRTLLQVTIDHAEEAERTLVALMGSEVSARKELIQSRDTTIRDIDV